MYWASINCRRFVGVKEAADMWKPGWCMEAGRVPTIVKYIAHCGLPHAGNRQITVGKIVELN